MRGAWIEIVTGEKPGITFDRRSPCGERRLKFPNVSTRGGKARSLPMRGAWIEISAGSGNLSFTGTSLPMRGAWIEIAGDCRVNHQQSRSPCGERGLKFISF